MKRVLPTREEIEKLVQKKIKDEDSVVKRVYEAIISDIQKRPQDILKTGIIYDEDDLIHDELDEEMMIKLFKLIIQENPGYQIGLYFKEEQGYVPIPDYVFQWDFFRQITNLARFKIMLK